MKPGKMIHLIRKSKKMTLKELSERSGVALATLSRMENCRMTGTLDSHVSIARALGVPLTDLYREILAPGGRAEMRSIPTRADVLVRGGKYSSESLVSSLSNKKMAPTIINIKSGGTTRPEADAQRAEKFVYVLEGKVEAHIGGTAYTLGRGDTIYFESSAQHYFRNLSAGNSRIICVRSSS